MFGPENSMRRTSEHATLGCFTLGVAAIVLLRSMAFSYPETSNPPPDNSPNGDKPGSVETEQEEED